MAVTHDSELFHKFGKRLGARTKMSVNRFPDVVVNGLDHLFGSPSFRVFHVLPVRLPGQQLRLESAAFHRSDVVAPDYLYLCEIRVRPINRGSLRQDAFWLRPEIVVDSSYRKGAENFLGFQPTLTANYKGFVIHRHQFLEDREITGRIAGRWQKTSEDARLIQDKRLAALPIASQSRQRLALNRHLFFVSFCRKLLDGKQPLDEGWSAFKTEGDYGLIHLLISNKGRL